MDYSALTVVRLRKLCRERGLAGQCKQRKAELIASLRATDRPTIHLPSAPSTACYPGGKRKCKHFCRVDSGRCVSSSGKNVPSGYAKRADPSVFYDPDSGLLGSEQAVRRDLAALNLPANKVRSTAQPKSTGGPASQSSSICYPGGKRKCTHFCHVDTGRCTKRTGKNVPSGYAKRPDPNVYYDPDSGLMGPEASVRRELARLGMPDGKVVSTAGKPSSPKKGPSSPKKGPSSPKKGPSSPKKSPEKRRPEPSKVPIVIVPAKAAQKRESCIGKPCPEDKSCSARTGNCTVTPSDPVYYLDLPGSAPIYERGYEAKSSIEALQKRLGGAVRYGKIGQPAGATLFSRLDSPSREEIAAAFAACA